MTRRVRLLALLASPILLSGCIADDTRPLNIFNPEGPEARSIDALHPWVFGIAGVIFVLVIGAVIWLGIANRVRPEDYDPEDLPAQTHGNMRLEVGWTILPAVILAGLAVPTVATIWHLERRDPDALQVMVIGQQWWWEHRYDVNGNGFFAEPVPEGEMPHAAALLDPEDIATANELVIPAGRRVELLITSRDIIHSYWIPRLNGKRDAVPGRYHFWAIEADEPGKFVGWCTEYCGLSHARMRMTVIALPEDEYELWFQNQSREAEEIPEPQVDDPAQLATDPAFAAFRGQELFGVHCAACHVIRSPAFEYPEGFRAPQVSGAAPDMTHFATRTVYGGAMFSTYLGIEPHDHLYDPVDYLQLSQNYVFNEAGVRAWIADAPALKDMAPPDRGMPAFEGLTMQELDDLVAYLATLD
jgi:cytochrome c oxidase subunit 2